MNMIITSGDSINASNILHMSVVNANTIYIVTWRNIARNISIPLMVQGFCEKSYINYSQ